MSLESFLESFESIKDGSTISIMIALIAGIVASAVCPCTLPVGIGMASLVSSSEVQSEKKGFPIAFSFFLGIIVNLTILGLLAGRLGFLLSESFGKYWALTMAFISLLAAYIALRGFKLSINQLTYLRQSGLIGSFLYGFIFSLGTSVAPLLLLLSIAASQSSLWYAIVLALAFGIGRGMPFLLIGIFSAAIMRFTRLNSWRNVIQIVSGIGLLMVSLYYTITFYDLL